MDITDNLFRYINIYQDRYFWVFDGDWADLTKRIISFAENIMVSYNNFPLKSRKVLFINMRNYKSI